MSSSVANYFSLLSEEHAAAGPNVGSGAVHLDHAPKTVSSTSSKKSDVNPHADPAKARPRSQGPPSNDRVLRDSKGAGRQGNRKVPVQMGADGHQSRRHDRTDRQSRTGKQDTGKRVRSGWGSEEDEPKDEVLGEQDAKQDERAAEAEDAVEVAPAAPAVPQISFDEYMKAQREEAEALDTRKPKKSAAAPAAAAPATQVPESRKKNTSKPAKEVATLELDVAAAPPLLARPGRSSERRPTTERRPTRGDKPARRGDKKGSGNPAKSDKPAKRDGKQGKPALDLSSLPTL